MIEKSYLLGVLHKLHDGKYSIKESYDEIQSLHNEYSEYKENYIKELSEVLSNIDHEKHLRELAEARFRAGEDYNQALKMVGHKKHERELYLKWQQSIKDYDDYIKEAGR